MSRRKDGRVTIETECHGCGHRITVSMERGAIERVAGIGPSFVTCSVHRSGCHMFRQEGFGTRVEAEADAEQWLNVCCGDDAADLTAWTVPVYELRLVAVARRDGLGKVRIEEVE